MAFNLLMRQILLFTCLFIFWTKELPAQNCAGNSSGFIPIADLGITKFQGFAGGKYPQGNNQIPFNHFTVGMERSNQIHPLNKNGIVDESSGKIGFMILGYSTAAMTGRTFISICNTQQTDAHLKFVIGAQGGRDINTMMDKNSYYWKTVDSILNTTNLSAGQIQIIWISTGDLLAAGINFPQHADMQIEKYKSLLAHIKIIFPNIKLVFISDRPYAGYIGGENGGPLQLAEPSGYYNSWAVKWVIENQIDQTNGFTYNEIPFIDWGPLLWTDGIVGNQTGYQWACDDAGHGGIHASSKGRMKEAALMYLFFSAHPYTKKIFSRSD